MYVEEYGLRFEVTKYIPGGHWPHDLDESVVVLKTTIYDEFHDLISTISQDDWYAVKVYVQNKEFFYAMIYPGWDVKCEVSDFLIEAASPKPIYKFKHAQSNEECFRFILFCLDSFLALGKTVYGRSLRDAPNVY